MQANSSEYERWEGRFGVPDYVFGKEPNYFLASCKPLLPRSGRALAVADGEGRNGVWLAEQGLDVLSIDFSPSAQRKAEALAKERGVTIAFARADVHTWDYPEAAFDVVVEIFLKKGVADPEGDATLKALRLLGFPNVSAVGSAKLFRIRLDEGDAAKAKAEQITQLCKDGKMADAEKLAKETMASLGLK